MDKKYTVSKSFTDAQGKTWSQGQEYTGSDAEEQMRKGNVQEKSQ